MEYDANKGEIKLNKTLNELDRFTIDFVNSIEEHIGYVIVSGYVSILLGRTRASEDVDLLIPKMGLDLFKRVFSGIYKNGFECANTSKSEEAYGMLSEHAIRFYKSGRPAVPNIEFKVIADEIQEEAFRKRIKVILKEKTLYISPIELQIAYKLSLMGGGDFEKISSDKDFEDAKHLYAFFMDKLNMEKLNYFVRLLKVEDKWKWLQK